MYIVFLSSSLQPSELNYIVFGISIVEFWLHGVAGVVILKDSQNAR